MYAYLRNIFQHFKKRNILYGNITPKNIAELKLWNSVHVDLIGPYSKSIRKHQPGGVIIFKNISLTYMTMIYPVTEWFEIIEIPTFDFDEVMADNDEYIDESSVRVIQFLNNT